MFDHLSPAQAQQILGQIRPLLAQLIPLLGQGFDIAQGDNEEILENLCPDAECLGQPYTGGNRNVRSEPNEKSEVLGQVNNNDLVCILAVTTNQESVYRYWMQIRTFSNWLDCRKFY